MTGDRDFIYPLGVAIASLARHTYAPIHLDFALPRDWPIMVNKEDVALVCELATSLGWTVGVVECPIDAASLPRTRHISSMTFMKPAYFDVSASNQVAFIDGDLIAVSDWSELLRPMVSGFAIEAARENNMRDFELKWNRSAPSGWYINAGVLKAHPGLWQAQFSERWRQLLATYDDNDFKYLEQDIMNAALLGNAGYISDSLNCRPSYGHNLDGAKIIHYAGWWKPWLTVPAELKHLPQTGQRAFTLYTEAERLFMTHVDKHLPIESQQHWRRARQSVRGRFSWRARTRYRRWAASQEIRKYCSNLLRS